MLYQRANLKGPTNVFVIRVEILDDLITPKSSDLDDLITVN
jgi:hypothetical protein